MPGPDGWAPPGWASPSVRVAWQSPCPLHLSLPGPCPDAALRRTPLWSSGGGEGSRPPPHEPSQAVAVPMAQGGLGELHPRRTGLVQELGRPSQQLLGLREGLRQLLLPLQGLRVALGGSKGGCRTHTHTPERPSTPSPREDGPPRDRTNPPSLPHTAEDAASAPNKPGMLFG